ncbi:diguanylate cyclase domain-containing protein [Kineococcus sp. SYSU DK003]|uniref:diguanylate cyclase domain-containing protein n=1 Tax=Kineococcus sp. SYSU DK003 TaxID=3383124 RepID=UPI003D7CCFDC
MAAVPSANSSGLLAGAPLLEAVEHSGAAVLVLDAEGTVAQVTSGFARLVGELPQDLVGARRLTWWLGLTVDSHERVEGAGPEELPPVPAAVLGASMPTGADLLSVLRPAVDGAVTTGSRSGVEADVDLGRSDGQLLVARVSLTGLPGGGAVLVARDITAERSALQQLRTLLARQDAVISASPDTIYRVHLLQEVVEWTNTGGASLLGLASVDRTVPTAPVHPDDAAGVERALESLRTAAAGEIVECTYRVVDGYGHERWVHTRSTVSDRSATGQVLRVVGIAQDLTETITTMDALAGSERRFHEIFARGPVGMVLFGLEGWISEVNDALCTLLERDTADLVGAPAAEVVDPPAPGDRSSAGERDDLARAHTQLEALLAGTEEVVHRERRYELPSGRTVWAQISLSLTSSSTGEPAFLAFVEDVTARKREAEQLEHAALHDPLTGLPNRAKAEDQLRTALARTQRRGGGCAVLFVDLDHFKDVNDTLGHAAGDALLRDVADRLRGLLRAGDLAARIGGDEFVLVCEDVADAKALAAIAERVCHRITIPVDLGSRTVVVSASVGAARTDGELTPEELLRAADRAMYRAKAAGRACWRAD